LTTAKANLEAIYPLSPMQEAVLLHSLREGSADDGFLQLRWELRGRLRVSAFKAAWRRVVERHPALRASCHWRDVPKPLQVVRRQVELPWTIEDWTAEPPQGRDGRLETFLREDRERGLDLSQAPTLRFALLQLEDDLHCFVWTCHHIFQDGWSGSLAFREFLTLYDAEVRGTAPQLQASGHYRDYVNWLKSQDVESGEAFWRSQLDGTRGPAPLRLPAPKGRSGILEKTATLEPQTAAAVVRFARENRLTLSTTLQGALVALLATYSGEDDVVFGNTVAGRPAEVPHAERLVGLLTNILPLRVRFDGERRLTDWLREVQERAVAQRSHEHTPISRIHEWSGLSPRVPLFETLLVFEDYGWEGSSGDHPEGIRVGSFCGAVASNVPLTLSCSPKPEFAITLLLDTSRYAEEAGDKLLGDMVHLLEAFVERPEGTLAELRTTVAAPTADRPQASSQADDSEATPAAVRASDDDIVEPASPTEKLVAQAWREALGLDGLSVYDNFFDMGGTSLLSLQVVEQLERASGLQINPGELVYQTLGQLAASLDERGSRPDKVPARATRNPLRRLFSYGGREG